mmetsp:Transcript_5062/g.22621  ORF Transcript_5062/g.22621 Transcript_5062/m.22621 type:complete len:239 (-) Transcript_5062:99-815(-)
MVKLPPERTKVPERVSRAISCWAFSRKFILRRVKLPPRLKDLPSCALTLAATKSNLRMVNCPDLRVKPAPLVGCAGLTVNFILRRLKTPERLKALAGAVLALTAAKSNLRRVKVPERLNVDGSEATTFGSPKDSLRFVNVPGVRLNPVFFCSKLNTTGSPALLSTFFAGAALVAAALGENFILRRLKVPERLKAFTGAALAFTAAKSNLRMVNCPDLRLNVPPLRGSTGATARSSPSS